MPTFEPERKYMQKKEPKTNQLNAHNYLRVEMNETKVEMIEERIGRNKMNSVSRLARYSCILRWSIGTFIVYIIVIQCLSHYT